MSTEDKKSLERREFLRKAAVTGAAAAWAAPLVQTVAATPAFAQSQGTPAGGGCFHSIGLNAGCKGACTQKCTGNQCNDLCNKYCPPGSGSDNPCCNAELCDPNKFVCSAGAATATFTGSLQGCPP